VLFRSWDRRLLNVYAT